MTATTGAPTTAAVDLRAPPDAAAIEAALARFAIAMAHRYGSRLRGLHLFGSRARGDAGAFSDVDVAVVADAAGEPGSSTAELAGIAYDVLLATGAEIHPWVFSPEEWSGGPTGSPALVAEARRDARPLETGR